MRWGTRALGLMVLAVLLILGTRANSAAAATQPALDGEFVGRVDGSDAFVCDGTDDGVGVWEWFRGTLDGDHNAPGGSGAGALQFAGTGGFNARTGTASITDGTSNTIVAPATITSGIIAILIG